MVYFVIDNLLSTSKNRPIMEALWFLSVSRSGKPEKSNKVFDNVSIAAICNELRAQINEKKVDARKFFFSTQLVFGTLQLYKIQIDKLYDQSKLLVQTWNSSQFNQNWLTQMSKKEASQLQLSQLAVSKSAKKKKEVQANKSAKKRKNVTIVEEKSLIPQNLADDLELMEDIFKIPNVNDQDDEEDTLAYLTSTHTKALKGKGKGKGKQKQSELIDQTMALHAKNITILEKHHVTATSGYQTLLQFEDDDFGEISNQAFQSLLKPTETETYACGLAENNTTTERPSFKPRRLTYNNFDDELHRNISNQLQQQFPLNVFDMRTPHKEFSTFDENANATEVSRSIRAHAVTMSENQTFPEISRNEMEIPNITVNEAFPDISHHLNETSLNISHNVDATLQPLQPEAEPEIVLERLDNSDRKRRRSKKNRSLIIDKQKILSDATMIKNFETYEQKKTEATPFENFDKVMYYRRNGVDEMFSSLSLRMQNASANLARLFTRNSVKIPESLLKPKKRAKQPEIDENQENILPSPPKKAKRTLRPKKSVLKESNQVVEVPIMEDLTSVEISPQLQTIFENDIDLPPVNMNHTLNETSPVIEIDYSPPEKKQRTNVKQQQLNKSSPKESEGSEHDKQVILSKLKKLWTKPSEPITMNKLCAGQDRFEAAKTFFELLLLSKVGVVELTQEEDSLEIANICCKVSNKELSKLCN